MCAAVAMPCRLRPDLPAPAPAQVERFGSAVGLAYQIADDLVEIEHPLEVTGKRGSDVRNDKATLPAAIGVEAARRRLMELRDEAYAALGELDGDTSGLRLICERACDRDH
jgi:farnesyl diphosphate synthase